MVSAVGGCVGRIGRVGSVGRSAVTGSVSRSRVRDDGAVPTVLDHLTISAVDFDAGFTFYDAALSALGLDRVDEFGDEEEDDAAVEAAAWGPPGAAAILWLVTGSACTAGLHFGPTLDYRLRPFTAMLSPQVGRVIPRPAAGRSTAGASSRPSCATRSATSSRPSRPNDAGQRTASRVRLSWTTVSSAIGSKARRRNGSASRATPLNRKCAR
jgi:hypothetical protein